MPHAPSAPALTDLDQPQAWQLFSRRQGPAPDLWDSHLVVAGMTCASCSLSVEQALLSVPGVHEATVNAASGMARVQWSSTRTRPSQWIQAIRAAGYDAVPVDDAMQRLQRNRAARTLLWRWLVAGFCMMQVMMYAVPAYLADPGDIGPDARQLMRWASWVLTLPVMLFSAAPFLQGAWRSLRARRIGMDVSIAFGLLMAFVASSIATFDPVSALGAEVWFDSVTMFVFFLLSARLLEQVLRERGMAAFESLGRSLPALAQRQRMGLDSETTEHEAMQWETVPIAQLRVGDVVRVRAGEAFPADGVLLEGATCVDESLLTGESRSRARGVGDPVIAGSHNLHATVCLRVDRTGDNTRHAGIVQLMQQAAVSKPAVAQAADRLAGPLLVLVMVCSVASAWWWWPVDPSRAVGVAVAVLIVTCPCALSLATPAALVAAAGALARRGVLLRRLDALSALAEADRIVLDKTGTLTVDTVRLMGIETRPGVSHREALAWATMLAAHSLHPLSRALVAADAQARATEARAGALRRPVACGVSETPGQGVQGWMSSPDGSGDLAGDLLRDGHPPGTRWRLGSAGFCALGEPRASMPGMTVHLCDDCGWVASFAFEETLREGVDTALRGLQSLGLTPELLSGDRAAAVQSLARRLGIDAALGGMTPSDKLAQVRALQDRGHRVVMVGDGLNDGPVLAQADASVALGDAAPLARAQADVLIPGGQIERLPLLVAHARRTRRVIRQNLGWAVAYNAVSIPLAMSGLMPAWLAGLGMAASSLFVVANAARLARTV
jgi:P-type Cu2+ transporter